MHRQVDFLLWDGDNPPLTIGNFSSPEIRARVWERLGFGIFLAIQSPMAMVMNEGTGRNT